MVRCSICGRRAVYTSRISGHSYCSRHFIDYFSRKVRRTIRKYQLFRPKDHIVVAVSGGKDSLALLHFLKKLSKYSPRWKITALLVDEGISGYRDITIKRFQDVVLDLKVDYEVVSFKEEIGYTLDRIVSSNYKEEYLPCTYCGVFRRYLINKTARRIGATVVATAHNLDDIIQTYIMNIIGNDWNKIIRLAPVSGPAIHPHLVRKVKPFYEILEKETTVYAIINNLYTGFEECPYARLSLRWHIRRWLNELEERKPGTKYAILNNLLSIINILTKKENINLEEEIDTCILCGEPSAHQICRACDLRTRLSMVRLESSAHIKLKELNKFLYANKQLILFTLR